MTCGTFTAAENHVFPPTERPFWLHLPNTIIQYWLLERYTRKICESSAIITIAWFWQRNSIQWSMEFIKNDHRCSTRMPISPFLVNFVIKKIMEDALEGLRMLSPNSKMMKSHATCNKQATVYARSTEWEMPNLHWTEWKNWGSVQQSTVTRLDNSDTKFETRRRTSHRRPFQLYLQLVDKRR